MGDVLGNDLIIHLAVMVAVWVTVLPSGPCWAFACLNTSFPTAILVNRVWCNVPSRTPRIMKNLHQLSLRRLLFLSGISDLSLGSRKVAHSCARGSSVSLYISVCRYNHQDTACHSFVTPNVKSPGLSMSHEMVPRGKQPEITTDRCEVVNKQALNGSRESAGRSC